MFIIKSSKKYGLSLIETLISVALLLFTLFAMFLVFDSTVLSSNTVDKKVELSDALNDRVDDYNLTGVFDTSSLGSITFTQQQTNDPNIIRFTANEKNIDISISKDISKYSA